MENILPPPAQAVGPSPGGKRSIRSTRQRRTSHGRKRFPSGGTALGRGFIESFVGLLRSIPARKQYRSSAGEDIYPVGYLCKYPPGYRQCRKQSKTGRN